MSDRSAGRAGVILPRQGWLRVLGVAVPVALVLGVAVGRLDSLRALIVFQVIVGGIGVWLVRALARQLRGAAAWRRTPGSTGSRDPVLRRLDDWENVVVAAGARAGHAHHRMRPRLRRLAAEALARRHIDLDADPERARAALGQEAYDWLRRDRHAPRDRHANGPGVACWDRIARAIERLDGD